MLIIRFVQKVQYNTNIHSGYKLGACEEFQKRFIMTSKIRKDISERFRSSVHSNFHHSGVLIYRQTRLKNRRSAENFDKSLKCEVETTAYRSFTLEQSRCAPSIELYILRKTLSKETFRLLKYKTEVDLTYFFQSSGILNIIKVFSTIF